jgi:hypothetical protein
MLVPAMAANAFKVGDFVVRIAETKNLSASTPSVAASSLRQAGYRLPAIDLGSVLTEGDVVGISNSLGIRVTTGQPDATFGETQVNNFFAAFSVELNTAADPSSGDEFGTDVIGNNGNGADPRDKGKGKKKGLRSPDDPV